MSATHESTHTQKPLGFMAALLLAVGGGAPQEQDVSPGSLIGDALSQAPVIVDRAAYPITIAAMLNAS